MSASRNKRFQPSHSWRLFNPGFIVCVLILIIINYLSLVDCKPINNDTDSLVGTTINPSLTTGVNEEIIPVSVRKKSDKNKDAAIISTTISSATKAPESKEKKDEKLLEANDTATAPSAKESKKLIGKKMPKDVTTEITATAKPVKKRKEKKNETETVPDSNTKFGPIADTGGTDEPITKTPETKPPKTKVPKSKSPKTKVPETKEPGIEPPPKGAASEAKEEMSKKRKSSKEVEETTPSMNTGMRTVALKEKESKKISVDTMERKVVRIKIKRNHGTMDTLSTVIVPTTRTLEQKMEEFGNDSDSRMEKMSEGRGESEALTTQETPSDGTEEKVLPTPDSGSLPDGSEDELKLGKTLNEVKKENGSTTPRIGSESEPELESTTESGHESTTKDPRQEEYRGLRSKLESMRKSALVAGRGGSVDRWQPSDHDETTTNDSVSESELGYENANDSDQVKKSRSRLRNMRKSALIRGAGAGTRGSFELLGRWLWDSSDDNEETTPCTDVTSTSEEDEPEDKSGRGILSSVRGILGWLFGSSKENEANLGSDSGANGTTRGELSTEEVSTEGGMFTEETETTEPQISSEGSSVGEVSTDASSTSDVSVDNLSMGEGETITPNESIEATSDDRSTSFDPDVTSTESEEIITKELEKSTGTTPEVEDSGSVTTPEVEELGSETNPSTTRRTDDRISGRAPESHEEMEEERRRGCIGAEKEAVKEKKISDLVSDSPDDENVTRKLSTDPSS